jgi:O-antigen ligase
LYVWLLAIAGLDSTAHIAIRQSGLLDGVGLLLAIWMGGEWWRSTPRKSLSRPFHVLDVAMVALCGWVLLTAAVAGLRGDFTATTEYRTRQFLLASVIFFATAHGYRHRWHLPILALPLMTIVLVEAVSEYQSLSLDQNVAAFAVLTIPAAVGAATVLPHLVGWATALAAVGLAAVVAVTRNRGGGLALFGEVLLFATLARRRWLWLSLLAVLFTVAIARFWDTGYFSRFEDIWTRGPDYASVDDRLNLWTASWNLAKAHPIVGVGPGNYGLALGNNHDPHNYLFAMLPETGFPGAAVYLLVFGLALTVALTETRSVGWTRNVATVSAAGVVGFLLVGFFLGLQTHALAFVYVGLARSMASSRTWTRVPQVPERGSSSRSGYLRRIRRELDGVSVPFRRPHRRSVRAQRGLSAHSPESAGSRTFR